MDALVDNGRLFVDADYHRNFANRVRLLANDVVAQTSDGGALSDDVVARLSNLSAYVDNMNRLLESESMFNQKTK